MMYNTVRLIEEINKNIVNINNGKDVKWYYYLSKSLTPNDLILQVNSDYNSKMKEINVKRNNIKLFSALEEMGIWYCENVYTYQGANKTIEQIEILDELNGPMGASYKAFNKWIKEKEKYKNENKDKQDKSFLDPTNPGDEENNVAIYHDCQPLVDLKKIKNDKIKTDVCDDCSKFAVAVYYYYLNKHFDGIKGIDLFWTGSATFYDYIKGKGIYNYINVYSTKGEEKKGLIKEFKKEWELQTGDLLVKRGGGERENGEEIHSHVEFYIDDESSFGWGKVQNGFPSNNSKHFVKDENGSYYNKYDENKEKYEYVVRLKDEYRK